MYLHFGIITNMPQMPNTFAYLTRSHKIPILHRATGHLDSYDDKCPPVAQKIYKFPPKK